MRMIVELRESVLTLVERYRSDLGKREDGSHGDTKPYHVVRILFLM